MRMSDTSFCKEASEVFDQLWAFTQSEIIPQLHLPDDLPDSRLEISTRIMDQYQWCFMWSYQHLLVCCRRLADKNLRSADIPRRCFRTFEHLVDMVWLDWNPEPADGADKYREAVSNFVYSHPRGSRWTGMGNAKDQVGLLGDDYPIVNVETYDALSPIVETLRRQVAPSIRAFRYIAEVPDRVFPLDDAGIPDELTVSISAGQFVIKGAKFTDTKIVDKIERGHFGKAVLASARSGRGTLEVGVPSASGHTSYFILLQEKDKDGKLGKLESKEIILASGDYSWMLIELDGEIAFKITHNNSSIGFLTISAAGFWAFGFAATVRRPKDQADITGKFW
jgi:hypothetical protein